MKIWIISEECKTVPVLGVWFTEAQATERARVLCQRFIDSDMQLKKEHGRQRPMAWRVKTTVQTVIAQRQEFFDAQGKPVWDDMRCLDIDEHEIEGCAIDALALIDK